MEKRYDINRYYAHDSKNKAILATEFETLAKFYEYAKEKGMQVTFCPMNHASKMVSNYDLIKL